MLYLSTDWLTITISEYLDLYKFCVYYLLRKFASSNLTMLGSTKKPGDISSAFSSTPNLILPQKFKDLKDSIKPKNLQESWNRLVKSFEDEIEVIQSRGPNIVPQIDFEEIRRNGGVFPANKVDEIKKRGCVVVRNVVDKNLALKYKADVQAYIAKNRDRIVGFPGKLKYQLYTINS